MGAWILAMVLTGGAGAPAGKITPSLICNLQHTLSKNTAWTDDECKWVFAALMLTKHPRRALAIMILESEMDEEADAEVSTTVHDLGLMQVRCLLDENKLCKNEPVKGRRPEELFSPTVNILAAAVLIASKEKALGQGWLRGYGGCRKPSCSYPRKVAAMETALSGKRPHLRPHDRRKSLYLLVAKIVKNHHLVIAK